MPAADAVDASVLVPVLDEAEHLPAVAAAMLGQRFDGTVEFLFVDGGSGDDTVAVVLALAAEDPRVRLLHNPLGHTPAALNIGLAAARGRYVVRMDAHTRYPEDYIAVGVARLAQGDVDHVSGPQLAAGYDAGSRRVAIALRSRLGVGGADFRRSAGEREVDSGFLGVWARERLVRLGGWDEAWVINQDAELAARLRADGGRLVCVPAMAAQYLPRNSLRALARQYFRYGRYRARTTLRHPTSLRKGHALPPGVVLASVGAVVLPRPLRRIARGGLTAYALALTAEGARLAATQDDATAADAVRLPAVFATMHLAWGAGVLAGLAQFSPTVRPGSGFGDRSGAGASSSSATISRPARSAV